MSNLNQFDNLISEELNSEEQATISGGLSFNFDELVETNDEVFYKSNGKDFTGIKVKLNVTENNYYYPYRGYRYF
ncbi:MAG: hypothetical protein QNJ49_01335 [Mastigocoleus sp. MO_167.B18]|uniref:hypothetical protein n=1 Tax=Mastigocoleus sp. MO_188.B34 TaxID=3036635 RepID=UPI002613961F|nr:hypothetical protein [Mastigocoleus sp. MO_188.B34]MDJ0694991.1 hypothetical protein [Mastigocoleus sp. MO_188.B34]MDJ0772059.1 hypothetical protein [Mastigocoleus sp. MO_167.B18]